MHDEEVTAVEAADDTGGAGAQETGDAQETGAVEPDGAGAGDRTTEEKAAGDLEFFTSKVETLKSSLEKAEAERDAAKKEVERLTADKAKRDLLAGAGIDAKYADLLHGPKDTWEAQAALLTSLKGDGPVKESKSVPRDPAMDADTSTETDRERAARTFFGI